MKTYYEEILAEIRQMLKDQQAEEAYMMIMRELKMPYIPEEAEKELRELYREAIWQKAEKKEVDEPDLEELLRRLKGKPQSQLAAAGMLAERNLRACLPQIRDYLAKDPLPEAAALIVDALAEQQIPEEFVWVKNGVEYTFWADDVTPVNQSEGFHLADQMLQKMYEKEPSLCQMARSLLIHEAYLYLPLSYEEDEAEVLTAMIRRELEEMM